jgi:hypothetical protein
MYPNSKYNFSGASIKNIGSIGSNNTNIVWGRSTDIKCIGSNNVFINDEIKKGVAKITIEYIDEKTVKDQILIKSYNDSLKIIVQGDCGEIKTHTGNVTVKGHSGDITTYSGDVIIEDGSPLSCHTKTGDISVRGDVKGDCNTKSGDIKVGRMEGYCRTNTGEISGRK